MITLGTSQITEEAFGNISKCIAENRIGQGRFVKEFEDRIAKYIGVKHAIGVCNGSMADIVALAALKEKHPEKNEVIVPALTFIAQTNAVLINGLKPVFIDIKEDYQIDETQVYGKINEKTLAVMPVHLLGKKCEIDKIKVIAKDIPILEDCCEAFGIKPQLIGTYSFYPSHTLTTGEGGMIVTDDDDLAELCRSIKNHGRKSDKIQDKFKFDIFGFNGKMCNLVAAVGCGIVNEADKIIQKRQQNVEFLNERLNRNWYADSPHCYPVDMKSQEDRDNMLELLELYQIESRKLFSCLPSQEKVYSGMGYKKGAFPAAEKAGDNSLYVPCHQDLDKEDLLKICQILKKHL